MNSLGESNAMHKMRIVQNSSREKIESSDEERFSQSFNIDEIAESPMKSPGGTDLVPTMSQASLLSGQV